MLVGLLRAAAVAALCLSAAAPFAAAAKSHSHSALRQMGGAKRSEPANLQAAAGFIMPYKETSDNMDWNTNTLQTFENRPLSDDLKSQGVNSVVLAFATGECDSAVWDGVSHSALHDANAARFQAAGMRVRLATGGGGGKFTCGSTNGFRAFVQPWVDSGILEGVDFDIEQSQSYDEIAALVARAKEGLSIWPDLVFSFTVAVSASSLSGTHFATPFPSGQAPDPFLGGMGATVLKQFMGQMGFRQGAPDSWPSRNLRINPMAMDYAQNPDNDQCVISSVGRCNMGQSAIQVAMNVRDHWGVPLSAVELTPMIGDNDTSDEHFTLANAATMVQWARSNGIAKVHYWAYDRDTPCGQAPAPGSSSDLCNTVGTSEHAFIQAMTQASADLEL